jgi:two-component system invasion response regulator UvrY
VIRILVADDHPVIRLGIRLIASVDEGMEVVGEAPDGPSVLAQARAIEHDVVLLDLSMPKASGLDVLKQLRREQPDIPVLILTMHEEYQFAIRALKSGAAGYVMKDAAPSELVVAIRRVTSGGRYLSQAMAERLAGHLSNDLEKMPHEQLSDREYQVFRLIAAGKTSREIAQQLSLSVKTVATYRARIFEKMQMKTPAELAAYVERNRLGQPALASDPTKD